MRIAVVGDVLLDVDVDGSAERLSPDAPVPVVSVERSTPRPGGAGLVAALLLRDGIDVVLVTAWADDDRALRIEALLRGHADRPGAGDLRLVTTDSGAPTPVKTRIRGAGHALVRLDEDADAPTGAPRATAEMRAALDDVDGIVVADYGRGLVADPGLRAAIERAGARVPVVWDPHRRGPAPVRSVAVTTPNASEAEAAGAAPGRGIAGAADAARALASAWDVPAVLLTLGARGALLHERGDRAPHIAPAAPLAGVDTCGAGDRLCGALAAALVRGASLPEAAESAVLAAARFLEGGGVAALAADGRRPERIGGAAGALAVVRETRARGGVVVATGGCFDLLHAGHARTLAAARALGDCLVVCLNSDASVRRLKGAERPIMGEADRRDLLLALGCVDEVVVFDETTPEAVLDRLRPDVWVKGGDYTAADLPETALLESWGGRVVTVPYHPGRSTTSLAGALARVG